MCVCTQSIRLNLIQLQTINTGVNEELNAVNVIFVYDCTSIDILISKYSVILNRELKGIHIAPCESDNVVKIAVIIFSNNCSSVT